MQREVIASRARSEVGRLLSLGVVQPDELRPCSADEIAAIEHAAHVRLPESYQAFLRAMGRGAGQFLKSDHWYAFYDDLPTVNRGVRQRLTDVAIPAEWFCFATRMGEAYLFFAADGSNDDPPIQCWSEGTDPKTETAFASFWDWFGAMVSDYAEWARK